MPRCQSRLMINVLLTLEEPLLPQAWCRHLLVEKMGLGNISGSGWRKPPGLGMES